MLCGSRIIIVVMVTRKSIDLLGNNVYWKPTLTDRNFNAASQHRQAKKQVLIKTPFYRAERIRVEESLAEEKTIKAQRLANIKNMTMSAMLTFNLILVLL